MRDQRLEIAVGMQEPMAALDAERADDHGDGLAHRDAAVAQQAIVAGDPRRALRALCSGGCH